MAGQSLKRLLEGHEPLLGTMVQIQSPQMVEVVGMAGFDYVVLDMEHTALAVDSVEELVRAAEASGLATIVRPPCADPSLIGRLLDSGVSALVMPRISTEAQARDAVSACRFPPNGVRGVCPHVRAGKYGLMPIKEYIGGAADVSVGVLIETKHAAENLRAIVAVPGIDFAMVGPTDLAFELGVSQGSARIAAVQRELDEAGRRHHVEVIAHVDRNLRHEQLLQLATEERRKMYWCSTDTVVCAQAYAELAERVREFLSAAAG